MNILNLLLSVISVLLAIVALFFVFGSGWAMFLLNFLSMSDGQHPVESDTILFKPTLKTRIIGIILLVLSLFLMQYGLSNLYR